MVGCALSVLALGSGCGDDDGSSPDASELDAGLDAATEPDAGPAFHPGPYGPRSHDRVGPFVAPTLDGALDFEASWTGEDVFLFSLFVPGNAYAERLWRGSNLEWLFEELPPNVQLVFVAAGEGADVVDHVRVLEGRFAALFEARPDLLPWRARLHFVAERAQTLEGALGERIRERGTFGFGVDRMQRWRDAGLLTAPTAGVGAAELYYLAFEARAWNAEHARDARLAALDATHGVTEVVVFDGARAGGGWGDDTGAEATVTLPDAATLATFDTLEVDLTTSCDDHDQSRCWEWDRLATLRLCDEEGCDVELARWITTYGREGRWVTDITHALALLGEGGARRLRWDGSVTRTTEESVDRRYVLDLRLRFSNRGKGERPVAATPVFRGGRFDEAYNEAQAPVRFTPPAGATRVELVTLITGHGFGAEASNCAEFCNHTHHFSLDGDPAIVLTHERAGRPRGCLDMLDEGVVPNQFGTWPFGRAGWCPGHDVSPWRADLSAALGREGERVLTYEAGLAGTIPYVPVVTDPDGYRADISLSAWLVFYR